MDGEMGERDMGSSAVHVHFRSGKFIELLHETETETAHTQNYMK